MLVEMALSTLAMLRFDVNYIIYKAPVDNVD